MAYRKITRFVTVADGTRIAYHTHLGTDLTEAQEDLLCERPAVLLTSGIGTSENFWRYLVDALCRTYRVVHWDYRGHGSSDVARGGDYSMQTQADDLRYVTEVVMARGRPPTPPLHVAFSMGVAVLLELYRTRPDLVPAMALIAGTPDAPWSGTWPFTVPGARSAVRATLAAMQPLVPLMAPMVHRLITSPLAYPAGRAIGLLRPHAPREDIDQMMHHLRSMDPTAYWRTLRELMKAHTSDVLPGVDVPVLIIAAANDVLAPASAVEAMRDALPHARWLRVDDAGHAGLLEAGPQVAEALEGFIQEMGEAQTGAEAPSKQRLTPPA